jgi:OOP family OmpA-OmpF porin
MLTRKGVLALITSGSALVSAPVLAADQGFYLGAGAGGSFVSIDDNAIQITGAATTSTSKSENDFAYKFFAGYQFNRNFAIEGGYINFGKFSITKNTNAGSVTGDIKVDGWVLDAVGILPLTNQFALFGKVGAIAATTKTSATASGNLLIVGNSNEKDNSVNFTAGFGAQFDLTPNLGLRAEYEFYSQVGGDNTSKGDINYLGASLLYKF